MSGLRVRKAGMLSMLGDRGRFGYGDIGITQSGAADRYSAMWANKLLFNSDNALVLEMLLGGSSFVAEVDTSIALTGAECELRINGDHKTMWQSQQIKKGETIEIGIAKKGLRAYLAVKGGFEAESILGSSTTTIKEGLGKKLQQGDLLKCAAHQRHVLATVPKRYRAMFPEALTLHMVAGYQFEEFEAAQRELFLSTPYIVTQETDRMGCRLAGESIDFEGEIISEAIAYGAIQIANDGQPIVLLNERQTIGGYPKIGSIIPMDCYRLAQARPHTVVNFQHIVLTDAVIYTKNMF